MAASLDQRVGRSLTIQLALIAILVVAYVLAINLIPLKWDDKVSIASIIAIPAAVIAVAQLVTSNSVQRASYIKDYALRFRSDRELTESFHYLVAKYGNDEYVDFKKNPEQFREMQAEISADLRYFNPKGIAGSAQERRLDNLLGFFDTLGYDYCRGLISMKDIAGVFGLQMDHFLQRDPIKDYIKAIKDGWPDLDTFHTHYEAPMPFKYFAALCHEYLEYQKKVNPISLARRRK